MNLLVRVKLGYTPNFTAIRLSRVKLCFFEIFSGWGDLIFFLGGGVPYPIFFGPNLLVRVKLGYTLNFTALGHLEVP